MAELKTKKTTVSPLKFIASVTDPEKQTDSKALLALFKEVTQMPPKMWGETGVGPRRKGGGASAPSRGRAKSQQRLMGDRGIIGFGSYHYESTRSSQKGDWPLTGFSPRKQNLTIYIMPGFKDYGALLMKLGKHTISGGSCIYIKRLSDIHQPTLKMIIKKSVAEMRRRYPSAH
ncbi:MAG: DUF1801 domain-containing protein [Minisyncoccia bacterium]